MRGSSDVLTFATSTLYLVQPPEYIQSAVEGFTNGFTAYLRRETEEPQPRINLDEPDCRLTHPA